MQDQEIDRALETALGEEEPRALARTVAQHNAEHIGRLIDELRVREAKLTQHIHDKMEDLRHTQRTIKAYELTLRVLT